MCVCVATMFYFKYERGFILSDGAYCVIYTFTSLDQLRGLVVRVSDY